MHTSVPADHSASPSVPAASPVSTIDLSNIPDDDTLSEYCCNECINVTDYHCRYLSSC